MLIVDAQIHIWVPNSPERPWRPGQNVHREIPLEADEVLREILHPLRDVRHDLSLEVGPHLVGVEEIEHPRQADVLLEESLSPVGQIVGSIDKVRPAREVVLDMVQGWIEATERLHGLTQTG